MSATPTAIKQQPPSPPQSNDGDFDLSAVQQHVAALDQQTVQPQIKSIGLAEQPTVSGKTSVQTFGRLMLIGSIRRPFGLSHCCQPCVLSFTAGKNKATATFCSQFADLVLRASIKRIILQHLQQGTTISCEPEAADR